MNIGILGAGHIGGTVGKLWAAAGHNVEYAASDLDASNAFARGGSAGLPLSALQGSFPDARWVRAYNTLGSRVLEQDHNRADPYAVLLSGDDADAKRVVAGLITDSGFAPVDLGSTADSVLQDPGSPLWNNPMTQAEATAEAGRIRAQGTTAADPIARAVGALADRGPDDPAWWFGQITRNVFQAGMSWRVVAAKWDGFRADFHDFDPRAVAAMTPADIAKVESDPQVIRNIRKIEATVKNASVMLDLVAEHGSFRGYLRSFDDPHQVLTDLTHRFGYLGESGAWRLLIGAARDLSAQ